MAQPVWVLSVDLQTKTATFQSGMADAAKSARGAFKDIGTASGEMASSIGKHGTDVRHTLGLVDNVLRGDHMRAFVDVIRIYQNSAVVMGALPFAAVAGGFALIAGIVVAAAVKMREWRMEQEKIAMDMVNLGTAGETALNAVRDRILEVQKHAAELHHNYLEALRIELELIDHQSLDDLVKQLESLSKAADKTFEDLKSHWYTLGIGATGASHVLEAFKSQYAALIAQGHDKDATDLLKGTLASARETLAALGTIKSESAGSAGLLGRNVDYAEQARARATLSAAGLTGTSDELTAQTALVETLQRQLDITGALGTLKDQQDSNAKTQTGQMYSAEHAAAAKEAIESQLQMGESAIAGEKAQSDAQLDIHRASLEERLSSDLDFASRDMQVKMAANEASLGALDKSGKDYQNQVKALNDKALEIQQAYQTQVAEITARSSEEVAARNLADMEESIRGQIEATRDGSSARLAAIDAAIREEQARQLQDTAFYRDLLTQRVTVARQMGEEQAKATADAGREEADAAEKSGELMIAAWKAYFAEYNSAHHVSSATRIAEEETIADEELRVKQQANAAEIAALDKSGKDYATKLKALQDKEKQMVQQHELDITQIKEKAEQARNQAILSAEQSANNAIAQSLTNLLMRHQTVAQAMTALGNQVVSGLMKNAIQSVLADDFTKERDAAAAARKAYLAGLQIGGPLGPVVGAAYAAVAFTSVMAFAGGGVVPGVGAQDTVPAMLTPGEGVVPGGVMDGLSAMARNGGFNQRAPIHVHAPIHLSASAIDGDGLTTVLAKHGKQLQDHIEKAVRKANR